MPIELLIFAAVANLAPMPSLSERGRHTPFSPFRKLAPLADKAKASGVKVYHLNIGQPDILTPPVAMQQLSARLEPILAYSPAEGNMSLRQKMVDYYARYDVRVTPEEIMVMTGASEALQLSLFACFNPGEEVLVPEPFYANYNGFAHIAQVRIKPLSCQIEAGFALPPVAAFADAIGPRTRGILLCNPNNPTGAVYAPETLGALGTLARQRDLFLIVDEVYREFCYDGATFVSALSLPDLADQVVVIDSVSKRYSACGARIGAVVTRNAALREVLGRYARLRLSPPGLGQWLTEIMLEDDMAYLQEVKAEYNRRRGMVYERLAQMEGVTSYLPGGAFYCFARFPIDDAERFCRWLLEDFSHEGATVMLSPGPGFYATPGRGRDEVRMAFVLDCTHLAHAMDCLEKALEIYPGRQLPLSTSIACSGAE